VLLVLVLLSVFLYNIGKGYTLLLDNKDIELPGGTAKALAMVEVQVDNEEPIELYPRDRDMVLVNGKSHTISITAYNKSFAEIGSYKIRFKLREKSDMFLLSMPALAAEAEDWISPFSPQR